MNKLLTIIFGTLLVFITACDSGDSGGTNASCDDSDVTRDWDGVTFDIEWIGECEGHVDEIGIDISSVDVHINKDGTYEFFSNGNELIDDEEGTWECNGINIDICETGDACATWSLDIDGNNATISTELVYNNDCTYIYTAYLAYDSDSDSGGDLIDSSESALQGLWALTVWCLEVNNSCDFDNSDDIGCSTVGIDDIVDKYIFVNDGITYQCDGTGGDYCNWGTYTLNGSSFEECDDDPECEEHSHSSDCNGDYGCWWDNDECIWEDGEEDDICTSGTVSLSDDNQTMIIEISGNYEGCELTQTSTYAKIGDSLEDYESLE